MAGLLNMECSAFATLGISRVIANNELVKPKKNGTEGRISKLAVYQAVVNSSYANAVTNAMGRECEPGQTIADRFDVEQYEPAPHPYADRVPGRGVYVHRDDSSRLYIQTHAIRHIGRTYWYLDGGLVDFSEIRELLHPKREGTRQPQQRKVIWRTPKPETVLTVKITPNTAARVTLVYQLIG
jgi:hypothetical protein